MFFMIWSPQEGIRPLHLAVEHGQTDITYVLITSGSNVVTKDFVRNL